MTVFNWGVASDVGQVRESNQDSADAVDGLFVVADGMGGHRGGEVASDIAVHEFLARGDGRSVAGLVGAVASANEAIIERARRELELHGMGTTLCAVGEIEAGPGEPSIGVINIGDSRVYLFADGQLLQITEDHSLVAGLVRAGRLTAEEAAVHPQRNIVTRALGIESDIDVDAWLLHAITGDRYLLCSDGLFNEVEDDAIAEVLRGVADPDAAAELLVEMANRAGGHDNVTVLVADVVEGAVEPLPLAERPSPLRLDSDELVAPAPGGPDEDDTVDMPIPVPSGSVDAAQPPPATPGGSGDAGLASHIDGLAASAGAAPGRRPLLTWRLGLFALVFVALVVVVIVALSSSSGDGEPSGPTTTQAPAAADGAESFDETPPATLAADPPVETLAPPGGSGSTREGGTETTGQ